MPCVLSEKAFKQNSSCRGVLQAFAGLLSRYMKKYQHIPYSGWAIVLFCLSGVFLFFRCFDVFVTDEKRKTGAKYTILRAGDR